MKPCRLMASLLPLVKKRMINCEEETPAGATARCRVLCLDNSGSNLVRAHHCSKYYASKQIARNFLPSNRHQLHNSANDEWLVRRIPEECFKDEYWTAGNSFSVTLIHVGRMSPLTRGQRTTQSIRNIHIHCARVYHTVHDLSTRRRYTCALEDKYVLCLDDCNAQLSNTASFRR